MILGIDIEGRRPTDRPVGDPQATGLVLRVAVGGTTAHLDIRAAGRDGELLAGIQVPAQSLLLALTAAIDAEQASRRDNDAGQRDPG